MNWLVSELEHGYITRYLMSEPRLEDVSGDKVAIKEESNVWAGSTAAATHENPLRKTFLAKILENGIKAPVFPDPEPEGKAVLLGTELHLGYRAPFGDPVAGTSVFSSTPRWISMALLTVLECPEEGDYLFRISVAGGYMTRMARSFILSGLIRETSRMMRISRFISRKVTMSFISSSMNLQSVTQKPHSRCVFSAAKET